jgi:hypothetical protein
MHSSLASLLTIQARIYSNRQYRSVLEAITRAQHAIRFRKRFLNPDTISIIPTGGYSGNDRYSKKALICLVYRKKMNACKIMHSRNGLEYRLPKLPHLRVDKFCPETKVVCEICGCYWQGNVCLPFRDVTNLAGDTLAERYEHKMATLEQIMRTGYQVELQSKCEFDDGSLASHHELNTPCSTTHSSEHSRRTVQRSNGGHKTSLQDKEEANIR